MRRKFLSVHSIDLALFLHNHTMFNWPLDDCYRNYVFEVAFCLSVPGEEQLRNSPERFNTSTVTRTSLDLV